MHSPGVCFHVAESGGSHTLVTISRFPCPGSCSHVGALGFTVIPNTLSMAQGRPCASWPASVSWLLLELGRQRQPHLAHGTGGVEGGFTCVYLWGAVN